MILELGVEIHESPMKPRRASEMNHESPKLDLQATSTWRSPTTSPGEGSGARAQGGTPEAAMTEVDDGSMLAERGLKQGLYYTL